MWPLHFKDSNTLSYFCSYVLNLLCAFKFCLCCFLSYRYLKFIYSNYHSLPLRLWKQSWDLKPRKYIPIERLEKYYFFFGFNFLPFNSINPSRLYFSVKWGSILITWAHTRMSHSRRAECCGGEAVSGTGKACESLGWGEKVTSRSAPALGCHHGDDTSCGLWQGLLPASPSQSIPQHPSR